MGRLPHERRLNLLKSYVGNLPNPSLKQASKRLKMKVKSNPYIIDDQKTWIETLMTANGNKPVISQERDTLKKEMETDNHTDRCFF